MSGSFMDAPWLAEPAPCQPGEIQQVAEREVDPDVLGAWVVVVRSIRPEVGFGALVGETPCCYAHCYPPSIFESEKKRMQHELVKRQKTRTCGNIDFAESQPSRLPAENSDDRPKRTCIIIARAPPAHMTADRPAMSCRKVITKLIVPTPKPAKHRQQRPQALPQRSSNKPA